MKLTHIYGGKQNYPGNAPIQSQSIKNQPTSDHTITCISITHKDNSKDPKNGSRSDPQTVYHLDYHVATCALFNVDVVLHMKLAIKTLV